MRDPSHRNGSFDRERWTEASQSSLGGIEVLEEEVMEREGQRRERKREREEGIREQRGRWTET